MLIKKEEKKRKEKKRKEKLWNIIRIFFVCLFVYLFIYFNSICNLKNNFQCR
jgi:hypothetical protein